MRSAIARTAVATVAAALVALGTAGSAAAHGGATLAEGGADGVRILLQGTDATTSGGAPAVDLSTVVRGPGTEEAVVTLWVRPSGGETFRVATTRDESGVSHADVATADRGDWRQWDVSSVVQLDDGTRLRVSNAEANPPGPDPAGTPGGGAKGPDADSDEGTATESTTETTTETVTTETETTETAPSTTEADDDGAPVSDVTGEDEGTPGWVVPSLIAVVVIALAWAIFFRRSRSADGRDDDQDAPPADGPR
jgi:hypothetical protein